MFKWHRILGPNQETAMATTVKRNCQKIWLSVANNRISTCHHGGPIDVSTKLNCTRLSMRIVVKTKKNNGFICEFRVDFKTETMFLSTDSGDSSSSDDENLSDNNNSASGQPKLNGNKDSGRSNQSERIESSANFPIPSTSTGITGNGTFTINFV